MNILVCSIITKELRLYPTSTGILLNFQNNDEAPFSVSIAFYGPLMRIV